MAGQTAEYDYEAGSYDESRFSNKIGRHMDYMHKKIVQDLNISGNLILDAGTGTGRFATWLAKKGFEVIGVDLSHKMLNVAKKKVKKLGLDISLILADIHFLPFKSGVFDGVICVNVIDHLSAINEFLKNIADVLKLEGYLIFNFSNILSPYLPIAIIVNSRKQALFKRGKIHSRWFTLREINALTLRNGFSIKEIKGCFIASPLPFGDNLVKIIQVINFSGEDSKLRLFSGSLFVKAQLINRVANV